MDQKALSNSRIPSDRIFEKEKQKNSIDRKRAVKFKIVAFL